MCVCVCVCLLAFVCMCVCLQVCDETDIPQLQIPDLLSEGSNCL
jgi:hypothetical protein